MVDLNMTIYTMNCSGSNGFFFFTPGKRDGAHESPHDLIEPTHMGRGDRKRRVIGHTWKETYI